MISVKGIHLVIIEFRCPDDQFSHDLCHEGLCLLSSLLHLLMTNLHRLVEATQISDNRDTKGTNATVVGHNHFWHSGHTNGIATHDAIHLIFCGRFEGWSLHTHIHTMLQRDTLLTGNVESHLDQQGIIGLMHIREAWTCGEVLSTKRMLREEIDMISDDHQVADIELGVHTSSGIRHEEGLDAQFVHHAYREGDLLHRVAFVEVEAPLHGQNINATQFAENQFTTMSLNSRDREIGNV